MQRYNLAIIVPLIEEFRVLRELVPSHIHHPEVEDAIYYYPLDLGEPDYQAVVVVLGDMGTTPAGQITEKILNTIQPKLVTLVGIAGALDRDVALGDVVVASEINEFLASSKAVPRGEDFIFEYSGRHWDVSFNIRQCVTNFEFADNRAWQSWQQTVSTYRTALNLPTNMPDVMHDVPKLHIGHGASGNTVGAAQGYAVELRCPAYLRYVDDMALFSDSKRQLWHWRQAVLERLSTLRLTVHPQAQVTPVQHGIPWLGFVVYPERRRVKARNVHNFRRRLRERWQEYCAGQISLAAFDASVQGWITNVRYADTWGLRQHVLDTPLRRSKKTSYALALCTIFCSALIPMSHNTACLLQPMIAHQEGVSVLLCSGCLLCCCDGCLARLRIYECLA